MLVSPWPPPSNQLNNKYFVNQVQSNLSSSNEAAIASNANAAETSTVATSHAAIETNKYFVSNVSLLSIESEMNSNSSTISPTNSSKSRLKTTLNPLMATNRTKPVQHHHHHGKTNGSTSANRTHFQIAQKQLTLSKNVRTEPPPMLNHILDSLSVSNSKHLHHDHRFVSSITYITKSYRLGSSALLGLKWAKLEQHQPDAETMHAEKCLVDSWAHNFSYLRTQCQINKLTCTQINWKMWNVDYSRALAKDLPLAWFIWFH